MQTRSAKEIVHRIFRIFNPKDGSWVNGAIDSIDEAIQGIGTPYSLESKKELVQIENFRGRLPCNLEYVEHVVDANGGRVYHNNDIGIRTPYGDSETMHGYKIEPGYIKAPFAKGCLGVAYKAIPRDKDGLPLLINEFDFIEACTWYSVSHMILAGHKHPEVRWEEADRRWEMYRARASNNLMLRSPDEMETISRMWLGNPQVADVHSIVCELYPKERPYPTDT